MEASTAVLEFQGCSCPCKHTSAKHIGRSDFVSHRIDSNSLAGSRQDLGGLLNLKLSRRQSPRTTRCLYSPLVESFEASRRKPLIIKRDSKSGESILTSSTGFVSSQPVAETFLKQDQQSSGMDELLDNFQRSVRDSKSSAPQDPVAAAHGDSSLLARAADAGHDLEARRSTRYQPQTMSLTQTFRAAGNEAVSCAIGVAGRPIANASRIGGPAGLAMGLVVATIGIATAVQRAAGDYPQKLCTRCDGYGVECCDVCLGAGRIAWEGKAHRISTCPRCFGSCLKKCPRCDGFTFEEGKEHLCCRS